MTHIPNSIKNLTIHICSRERDNVPASHEKITFTANIAMLEGTEISKAKMEELLRLNFRIPEDIKISFEVRVWPPYNYGRSGQWGPNPNDYNVKHAYEVVTDSIKTIDDLASYHRMILLIDTKIRPSDPMAKLMNVYHMQVDIGEFVDGVDQPILTSNEYVTTPYTKLSR